MQSRDTDMMNVLRDILLDLLITGYSFYKVEPTLEKNSYAFLEFNSLLNNKDIGLFNLNKKILIRRFYNKKGKITLKADNKEVEDIVVKPEDTFFIIGKFLTK